VTLIRLKKTINEYLNNTTIESFDGKISTIGDYNFQENWGNKNDTVVLAMTYQDLNVMIVKELPPYDVLTFLSETGGVLGLLLGTSLVNLIVFLIQWAWGLKFNETNWTNVQNRKEEEIDFDLNVDQRFSNIGLRFGVPNGNCFGSLNKENNNKLKIYDDKDFQNNDEIKNDNNKDLKRNEKEKKNEYACDINNVNHNYVHRVAQNNNYKTRENDYFNTNSDDIQENNKDAFIYQKISII